jgi:Patatin-like phospholipase
MNQVTPLANPHFPDELSEAEAKLIAQRRNKANPDDAEMSTQPQIGLALSGGGIRSATFSLGLVQALAKLKLLPRVDYLSTVSGGGYFGSFLGALFARPTLPHHQKITADKATVPENTENRHQIVDAILNDNNSKPLRWLRDNGRYLTPNGGGDAMMALAMALRNWVSVVTVMMIFTLTLFLAATSIELIALSGSPKILALWKSGWWFNEYLWWSPWFILPLASTFFFIIPFGWAYWLPPAQKHLRWVPKLTVQSILFLSLITLMGSHLTYLVSLFNSMTSQLGVPSLATTFTDVQIPRWVNGLAISNLITAAITLLIGRMVMKESNGDPQKFRKKTTYALSIIIPVTAALAAFSLIDTLGRTIYTVHISNPSQGIIIWLSGAAGSLFVMFTAMQKYTAWFLPSGKSRRAMPMNVTAGIIALLVMGSILSLVSAMAHGIGWSFKQPMITAEAPFLPSSAKPERHIIAVDSQVVVAEPTISQSIPATELGDPCPGIATIACVIGALLTYLTSLVMSFVNHSSLAPVYAARLARSYLGASNPIRQNGDNRITDMVTGDDFSLKPNSSEPTACTVYAPHQQGGPLHLINVTINETLDGQSGLQNLDRKGVGMAFGPAGISVGVNHHTIWQPNPHKHDHDLHMQGLANQRHQVFPVGALSCESLSVGRLIGISGAAFSTGIGSRTSIGMSLLCGLFNVRTGYWWRSGTHQTDWPSSIKFLLYEWLARFPGTAWNHWYLSDGGHFENLACYELIRRSTSFIICLDNGEDPTVLFEDLGGLVRKARLDFGAEITFLNKEAIEKNVGAELKGLIGTLDDLRPQFDKDGEMTVRPTACATLAHIRYADGIKTGTLLYIKPTVMGDEPEDVRYYQRSHPSFPHEPTIDQFFDEAQWESYRRLGEHLGNRLFSAKSDKWYPGQMTTLPASK